MTFSDAAVHAGSHWALETSVVLIFLVSNSRFTIHVEFLGISALLPAVRPGGGRVQGQTRVSSSLMVSAAALAVSFVSS